MIIAVVAQFFKTVVDYSRVENTQFEDEEYYYYVKAVPKIVMTKQQKNVKRSIQYHRISLMKIQ